MKKDFTNSKKTINLDVQNLTTEHVRLIKTIQQSLITVINTSNEKEFFENSSELIRYIAQSIENSKFTQARQNSSINYGTQAIEYGLENLHDCIKNSKITQYDN